MNYEKFAHCQLRATNFAFLLQAGIRVHRFRELREYLQTTPVVEGNRAEEELRKATPEFHRKWITSNDK